ncbi:MAG: hypothetical protein QM723_31685 [Myxococcaceae bacterium]
MWRVPLLSLAVVTALGCGGGGGPCTTFPSFASPKDPGGVAGQVEHVDVGLGVMTANGDCSKVKVTSANAAVADPDNAPVQATVEVFNGDDLPNAFARVTFTPPKPGAYHLSVRFEPNFGTLQRELLVGFDRSDASGHSAPALTGCTQFGVSNGQPLCGGEGQLHSLGANAQLDQIDAGRFTVDEAGRVWTTDEGLGTWTLRAWSVDAGTFVPLAKWAGTGSGSTQGLLARGGRAVVMADTQMRLFVLETDGGITNIESHANPQPMTPQWCMQFVPPAQLALSDPLMATISCFLVADTSITCSTLPFSVSGLFIPAGADDQGLWWSDGAKLNLWSATSEGDGGQIVSVSAAFDLNAPDCSGSEASPVTAGLGLVPRLTDAGIVFEKFPTPAGSVVTATSRYVVANSNGLWLWWDR